MSTARARNRYFREPTMVLENIGQRQQHSDGRSVAIRMEGITKRFGSLVANHDIDLSVYQGEVHALVGENGAGKTTLMNILYGMVRPDSGHIFVGTTELPVHRGFLGPDYGIGMIHQHFMLVRPFSVLENIILGTEPRRGIFLDLVSARRKVVDLMGRYGIEIDLDRRVEDLSVGEEQRVEILKVLYRNARIIIMDEPTAVLTPQEIDRLFETVRMLVAAGHTLIFITHKLEEVMEIADRVTVLRQGRVVGTRSIQEVDPEELAIMMVGRKIEATRPVRRTRSATSLFRLENICLRTPRNLDALSSISLDVRQGEILGICGVEGNGQDELFEVAIGIRKPSSGKIFFQDEEITGLSAARRLRLGIGHIPPDRIRMGIVPGMTVKENIILGRHVEPELAGSFFLKDRAIRNLAVKLLHDYGIVPPAPEADITTFSGGNQQKIVVARELSRKARLLIASQPTRGLDIMATKLIHDSLLEHAENGGGVLLISADLAEIMDLSDRIAVMYRGRILRVLEREHASEEQLGLLMAGVAG